MALGKKKEKTYTQDEMIELVSKAFDELEKIQKQANEKEGYMSLYFNLIKLGVISEILHEVEKEGE